jgi:hemerythrin-like domain-containing protein
MPVTSTKRRNTRTSNHSTSRGKDAIALLMEDHKNVRQLLKRLEATTERSTDQREQLLTKIENEVKIHTTIEEEIFYPAYRDAVRTRNDQKLYFEALEEHHVVDLVMPEIKNTETDADEFGAKAKVLKDLIEHHAEEEETRMFPKARKAMGAARLKQLGQELEERRHELSTGLLSRNIEGMRIGRRRVA